MTKPTKGKTPKALTGCSTCGGRLGEYGFCESGGGFQGKMECPFSCPICRFKLSWDGGCNSCHGTANIDDRASWTFPGDRYWLELGHWVFKEGPAEAVSMEQSIACNLVVQAVLDKKISELRGQERVHEILHPEIPF